MKIEELREIAKARTPGEWRYEDERYSAKCVIGLTNDDRWIASCQPEFNGESNGKMIVAMSKHIDALLDLWEAAQEVIRTCGGLPGTEVLHEMEKALEKLEAIK